MAMQFVEKSFLGEVLLEPALDQVALADVHTG
jgi:hypothetical protein